MASGADAFRWQLKDIGDRIETARRSIEAHGVGGEDLDAELCRMRTAQRLLRKQIERGDGGTSSQVLAAEAENLRNTFERWIVSNEHRFSGATHKHT